jgi:hypothetical protein
VFYPLVAKSVDAQAGVRPPIQSVTNTDIEADREREREAPQGHKHTHTHRDKDACIEWDGPREIYIYGRPVRTWSDQTERERSIRLLPTYIDTHTYAQRAIALVLMLSVSLMHGLTHLHTHFSLPRTHTHAHTCMHLSHMHILCTYTYKSLDRCHGHTNMYMCTQTQ